MLLYNDRGGIINAMSYVHWRDTFKGRLRALIERHHSLTIAEVGKRIGQKSGANISALIGKSRSSRDDCRMSTFLKLCNVLAEAYEGRMTEREIVLFLLGLSVNDILARPHDSSSDSPFSRESKHEVSQVDLHAE